MQRDKKSIEYKRHILFTVEEHNIKHKDADFNLQKGIRISVRRKSWETKKKEKKVKLVYLQRVHKEEKEKTYQEESVNHTEEKNSNQFFTQL